MTEIIFQDDMKSETKKFVSIFLFGVLMAIAIPLLRKTGQLGESLDTTTVIVITAFFGVIGLVGLCGLIYVQTYQLTVTNDEIQFRTIFNKVTIQLKQIKDYENKRYNRSTLLGFKIYYADKSTTIYTRHAKELSEILDKQLEAIDNN